MEFGIGRIRFNRWNTLVGGNYHQVIDSDTSKHQKLYIYMSINLASHSVVQNIKKMEEFIKWK
jgi:hypothetical protein